MFKAQTFLLLLKRKVLKETKKTKHILVIKKTLQYINTNFLFFLQI